jgi:hypothetical protein
MEKISKLEFFSKMEQLSNWNNFKNGTNYKLEPISNLKIFIFKQIPKSKYIKI